MVKIDHEYVKKLINEITEGLDEIKNIITLSIDDFIQNRSMRFSMRYSIVLIVEAAADLGLIILRSYFNEKAENYREIFLKLTEKGVLSYNIAERMSALTSLRNMIVHRYWSIDDVRIYREAKNNGVRVIEKFIKEVEKYVFKKA